MSLHLVRFTLETREYPDTQKPDQQLTRLVEAGSPNEAHDIVEAHYRSRSDTYGTSYYVHSIEVLPTIR